MSALKLPHPKKRYLFAAMLVFVTLLTATLVWLRIDSRVPASLRVAREYYAHKEYSRAEKVLKKALEWEPWDEEVLREMVRVEQALGATEQLTGYYKRLVIVKPRDADSFYRLGLLERSQGKSQDALRHLAKAAELRPDVVSYSREYAFSLVSSGRPSLAARVLGRIEANPGLDRRQRRDILVDRARFHVEAHETSQAVESLRKVLRVYPGDEEAEAILARLKM